jgi:DNA-binding transcriptional LysR family regulator
MGVTGAMDYLSAMRAFVRAVELKSFSKVAAEIGTKVSTVSRYIGSLEADLGVALFNRSTHGLKLTEAGRTFHEHAAQILIDLDQARTATSSLNSSPRGLLRINMPSAFGRRHVMPHMKDFLGAYPDIRIDATLTDATVDLIENGVDVAIRIGALVDSTLIAKRLAPQRRLLVASPAYLDSRAHPTSPADLKEHECLLFAFQPTGSWHYRRQKRTSNELLDVQIEGRLRTNDSEALRDAALSGLGLALLPTWLVGHDVHENRLVNVLSEWEWLLAPGPDRAIWSVYPPKKVVSPKVRSFVEFMTERFGKVPYWDLP